MTLSRLAGCCNSCGRLCISNISDQPQSLQLSEINLLASEHWRDLISEKVLPEGDARLLLQPYQTLWIGNDQSPH